MKIGTKGKLWSASGPHMIVVTANSMELHGGLSAAGTSLGNVTTMYPNFAVLAAQKIREAAPDIRLDGTDDYGFVEVFPPPAGIGIFQIRRHSSEVFNLDAVRKAAIALAKYAEEHPDVDIRMGLPGKKADPLHIMEQYLPDNVTVFKWRQ